MPPRPTVFVVDDDAAMRASLRWLLETEDLTVETFATAEEFLGAYDPATPGCLVLDVRLPGMGGFALQRALVARNVAHLPIIFITAYGDASTSRRALQGGAFDFIEKPFSDDVILDRIRQAMEADRRAYGR